MSTKLLAMLVDAVIVLPLGLVLAAMLGISLDGPGLVLAWLVLWIVYDALWSNSPRGRTPGELATGYQRPEKKPPTDEG